MKIKELTVMAVIPTGQYANLQPSVTVEVDGDYEEAKSEAMSHIAEFSQQYAENGKAIGGASTAVDLEEMTPWVGKAKVFFDEANHIYTNEKGVVYLSGSKFAHQYGYEFPVDAIAPVYAKKFGLPEQTIRDFWSAKAVSSTTFGTALHQALETFGKFHDLPELLSTPDKPVVLGLHPTLEPIVQQFFTPERLLEEAVYEPLVVDSKSRCGQIDRLVIVDAKKKICDIEDYKTNGDLTKQNSPKFLKAPYNEVLNQPIGGYQLQLSFYKAIMEDNGWTVRNLKIHHWDGKKWNLQILDAVKI